MPARGMRMLNLLPGGHRSHGVFLIACHSLTHPITKALKLIYWLLLLLVHIAFLVIEWQVLATVAIGHMELLLLLLLVVVVAPRRHHVLMVIWRAGGWQLGICHELELIVAFLKRLPKQVAILVVGAVNHRRLRMLW